MQTKFIPVYRRLLRYTYKQRVVLFLAILSMMVVSATGPMIAGIIKYLIDNISTDANQNIINWMPLMIIGTFTLHGVFSFFSIYLMTNASTKIIEEIRNQILEHMLKLPLEYFENTRAGRMISRMTHDTNQISAGISRGIILLLRDTFSIIALLIWIFYISWQLSIYVVPFAIIITLLLLAVIQSIRHAIRLLQDKMADITQYTSEIINGQRLVKIFNTEKYEIKRFRRITSKVQRAQIKITTVSALQGPITSILFSIFLSWIIYIFYQLKISNSISNGTIVSFITAMLLLIPIVQRISSFNEVIQKSIIAGESIFSLLDTPIEIDTGTYVPKEKAKGELVFEHVNFSYPNASKKILSNINITIPSGKTLALVGLSGGGKSTLVSLIPRFYTIDEGRILLDCVDINEYRLKELRQQIAYVGQHVFLFNDTIMANVAYGSENASEEEIIHAAEIAHAMEFIEKMPQGMNSLIGDNGSLLSGGQRQRLAIARAILLDAPILILDEATSALDNESEYYIQTALSSLQRDRTTLMIAHRLSTIEHADEIIVLEKGHIVEQGKHNQLLALNGSYTKLHQL